MEQVKKAIKPYFKINAGVYSGLYLEKRLATRVAKLLYKQNEELKELLAANLDETEVYDWTLCYPDTGEQTVVHFFNPDKGDEEKLDRIKLFNRDQLIQKVEVVFMAGSMEEAEKIGKKYYNAINQ
jgi:hypothetical protein